MTNAITRRGAIQRGLAAVAGAVVPAAAERFDAGTVASMARDLAGKPYRAPDTMPRDGAGALTYEQYRGIRFRPNRALWRDRGLPFQVQFFPRGFLYRRLVEIHEVWDGRSAPIAFDPDLFEADDKAVRLPADLGFAGLRVHAPINRPGAFEEFCVFLGASYFRAVGRNLDYGISARGLALGTGSPGPEEFPDFRAFWLERPGPGHSTLIIHALLDSPSVAGAYRFALRPGATTGIDVECVLYPRADLEQAGVAPLTSMYFFADGDHGQSGRPRVDDWRTAVHDSDGLAIATGRGEHVWRKLANPSAVQFSAFADADPSGFGLLQRTRAFEAYGDLQVPYGRRPGLWIEPVGGWGPGSVDLVEIPTDSEYNDNMVAFWRGRAALRAGGQYRFAYRMRWGLDPAPPADLARVAIERSGAGVRTGTRVFVLDLAGAALRALRADAKTSVEFSASAGALTLGYSGPLPDAAGWRLSLDFDPEGATMAELRCRLLGPHGALSETWLHRWLA